VTVVVAADGAIIAVRDRRSSGRPNRR